MSRGASPDQGASGLRSSSSHRAPPASRSASASSSTAHGPMGRPRTARRDTPSAERLDEYVVIVSNVMCGGWDGAYLFLTRDSDERGAVQS